MVSFGYFLVFLSFPFVFSDESTGDGDYLPPNVPPDTKETNPVLQSLFSYRNKGNMIGGKLIPGLSYPEVVAFLLNGEFECTGAIISLKYILTSKSCIVLPPEHYVVVAGENHLTCDEGPEQYHRIKRIITPSEVIGENLAIVELEDPFPIRGGFVEEFNFPDDNIDVPESAYSAGWGTTNVDDPISTGLRRVNLTLSLDDVRCLKQKSFYVNVDCYISPTENTCYYDDGAPLFYDHGDKRVLIGILAATGCEEGHGVSIFHRITKYKVWILETAGLDAKEDLFPSITFTDSALIENACRRNFAASSVRLRMTNILMGQRCYYAIKTKYTTVRIKLVESNLPEDDRLWVSGICSPCEIHEINVVNQSYYIHDQSRIYVHFHAYHKDKEFRSFTLDIFSSGYPDHEHGPFTNMLIWNAEEEGRDQYPPAGQGFYRNEEDVLIIFDPLYYTGVKKIRMNYTFLDIKDNPFDEKRCSGDHVELYAEQRAEGVSQGFNIRFRQDCGTLGKQKQIWTLPGERGFFRFRSDLIHVGKGFGVSWWCPCEFPDDAFIQEG